MLVRVKGFWVNPNLVVAIWHQHVAYGDKGYWVAKMRCDEGQSWEWKYPTEEDAVRAADKLAAEVNAQPHPWLQYADEIVAGDRQ